MNEACYLWEAPFVWRDIKVRCKQTALRAGRAPLQPVKVLYGSANSVPSK